MIGQGNRPVNSKFNFDEAGIGTFLFQKPIDPELLKEKFDFPQNIIVADDPHYGDGVVWDKDNALIIYKG